MTACYAGRAQAAGISTVYQEVNLCANLSVGENVMLGHEPRNRRGIDWKVMHREATRHLEHLGLRIGPRSILSSHSIAVQQLVAISRAMVLDARVLILDEPTSALGVKQASVVLRYVAQARARGLGVIFITHNVRHAHAVGDKFTVLNRGQTLGTFTKGQATIDELQNLMAGGKELDELSAELEEFSRADAAAASQPACPPPITMTSHAWVTPHSDECGRL